MKEYNDIYGKLGINNFGEYYVHDHPKSARTTPSNNDRNSLVGHWKYGILIFQPWPGYKNLPDNVNIFTADPKKDIIMPKTTFTNTPDK